MEGGRVPVIANPAGWFHARGPHPDSAAEPVASGLAFAGECWRGAPEDYTAWFGSRPPRAHRIGRGVHSTRAGAEPRNARGGAATASGCQEGREPRFTSL